ncbi:MAG TPA: GntR family transcriptional regulator [Symbiobacteriaceae bacterium]|nr:GntR family transcriptional regulator [Symbiobacteriaceae bacterium]
MARRLVPRHQAIEEYLRERIAAASPGAPLPTDKELCDRCQVSRMTARLAVSRLAEAGLVTREPGKGTFVAHPRLQREASVLLSFTRQMERQGRVASSALLERSRIEAPPDVSEQLHLPPNAPVLLIRRIRLADGIPTALEWVMLPEERFGWLMAVDLERGSLHEALESRGILPYRGQGALTASVTTRDEAHLLGLPAGSPLLVERLVLFDQNGAPIQAGETRYAAQRYALDFHLHRNAR